jgi:aldose 1-epimerase
MPLLTLQNEHLRVVIHPEAGASLVACEFLRDGQWIPLMRPTPPTAIAKGNSSLMASYTLAPYSNRLSEARFQFNGQTYPLRANTREGHALHGDVRKRPWQLMEAATPTSAAFSFDSANFPDINFPFPFTVLVRYELKAEAFDSTFTLTNRGQAPMPAGFGFHPYFNRTLTARKESVELQACVSGVYPELVPDDAAGLLTPEQNFSQSKPLDKLEFDHCFAGWDGRATLRWPKAGVTAEFDCDSIFSHLVLFTPPARPFFALEPVTNANNGFNLYADGKPGSGVRVLGPGESMGGRFRLRVSV